MESISSRYQLVRESVPGSVRLVAITKGHELDEIKSALSAGCLEIGENKIQEAEEKNIISLKESHPNIVLHMVGHLQRNKVKMAVSIFDVIQSVDSIALARKIANEAAAQKKCITIYLQFRVSGHESQDGFIGEEELESAAKEIRAMQNEYFKLEGLMGIASVAHPRENFEELKAMADRLKLPIISMGMSGDYRIAIEAGSTMVRIGTAIFGERDED